MPTHRYHAPTAVYYGPNCIRQQSEVIRSFGRKAYIITSLFVGKCPNLALQDMLDVFSENDISYSVCIDVEENPSVESVKRIAEKVRAAKPDFLVGIGGGSALDTAKAVNVLLGRGADEDAYKVFYSGEICRNQLSSGVLPLLAVPTTAGSGSEVMGYAILTRADTNTKLRMNQLSFVDAAFLDAKYVSRSPQWLLDSGAMDALAHGVEGTVNAFSSRPGQMWHDYGFELFSQYKDHLLACTLNNKDYEKMLIAATVQGMGIMQSGTTIPHGMGYALTHFKGVSHGIASCMTIPAYLDTFRDRRKLVHIVSACGFTSLEEMYAYIAEIVRRNVSISVTMEEIEQWTDECCRLKVRLERHPEEITREQIRDIYIKALSPFICKHAAEHSA